MGGREIPDEIQVAQHIEISGTSSHEYQWKTLI